jgi:hypothetical protein
VNLPELKDGEHLIVEAQPVEQLTVWFEFCKTLILHDNVGNMNETLMRGKIAQLRDLFKSYGIEAE